MPDATKIQASSRHASRSRHVAALLLTLSLVVAACGGDAPVTADAPVEQGGDAGGGAVAPAEVIELTVATFFTSASPFSAGYTQYFKAIEEASGGRVKFVLFEAGSLLEQTAILSGVSTGRADIGVIADAFHPGELPLNQAASLPFVTSNSEAQVRAFQQVYDSNEAFQQEYSAQNLRVLYFVPPGPNTMQSTVPVASLDDLRGVRVRALGVLAQALSAVGATTVSIALPEVYEALGRGVIDAALTGIELVRDLSWFEVAEYTINPGTGMFISNPMVINLDVWESLPDDVKQLFEDAREDAIQRGLEAQVEAALAACAEIAELGGTVLSLPDDVLAEWEELVWDDLRAGYLERAGAAAEEFLDQYLAAIAAVEATSDFIAGPSLCQ